MVKHYTVPELEQSIKKHVGVEHTKFVSDEERAARIESDKIDPNEIIAPKGEFNALGGTTHFSEEEAHAASDRYLARMRRGV